VTAILGSIYQHEKKQKKKKSKAGEKGLTQLSALAVVDTKIDVAWG
jgi:hypothetical protein